MRKRLAGLAILLIVGEALGLGLGSIFFHLFEKKVPPAVLTSFNKGTAHAAFLVYGAGAGFLIFIWGVLVAGAAPFFKARPSGHQ
jgi:hypothetical protein